MFGLIATAAAGLNAGAGLQTLITDQPAIPFSKTTTDPLLLESYWTMFHEATEKKLASSSTIASIAAASALAAYFTASNDNAADPAWLTCSLLSAIIPLYNMLFLSPKYISNIRLAGQSRAEKITWVNSFKSREFVGVCLSSAVFGCTLLVLASRSGEHELTANPLRFLSS